VKKPAEVLLFTSNFTSITICFFLFPWIRNRPQVRMLETQTPKLGTVVPNLGLHLLEILVVV
jgi:hypothetical protein